MTEESKKEKDKKKCGLIMPISSMENINNKYTAEHWEDIKKALQKFLEKDYIVELVSDSKTSEIIQAEILNSIFNDDIVICDISGSNPNVMFELGLRIAFNKRVIVIFDKNNKVPFDINSIPHLTYPEDLNIVKMENFSENLRQKIKELLKKEGNSYIDTYGNLFKDYILKEEKIDIGTGKLILEHLGKLEDMLLNRKKEPSQDIFPWFSLISYESFEKELNNSFLIKKLLESSKNYNDFFKGVIEYIMIKYPSLKIDSFTIQNMILKYFYMNFNNNHKEIKYDYIFK